MKLHRNKTHTKPFTVYLPKDLEQWLRAKSQQEGRTLTATTERAIRAYKAMLEQTSVERSMNGQ